MKILLSIIFTILIIIVLGIVFIFSGVYNVSALNSERGITRWILNTTSDKSVEHYSKGIKVPNLSDPNMIKEGLAHYKEMCESCHRAPGKEETELAKGLNPDPPDFVKHGNNLDPAEAFWITKNGIKMTGMPAWGKTHSDEKIWAIVAAVKKLHDVTKEEYNSISSEEEEHEGMNEANQPELRYH